MVVSLQDVGKSVINDDDEWTMMSTLDMNSFNLKTKQRIINTDCGSLI